MNLHSFQLCLRNHSKVSITVGTLIVLFVDTSHINFAAEIDGPRSIRMMAPSGWNKFDGEVGAYDLKWQDLVDRNENIKISTYNIIYEVLDYIKQRMSGLLTPDVQETITGTAQILEIFKVSGAGKVAGSKVTDGEINSNSDVRVIRDGSIIFTGKVGSLFREKNQVKQVNNGQECGIALKDYMDFKKNDTIEAFSVTSKERTI